MDGHGYAQTDSNGRSHSKGIGKGNKNRKGKGKSSVSASPRQGMIWDGFQWHSAPTAAEAEEYRAQKVPVTQLKQMAQAQALAQAQMAQAQAVSAQLNVGSMANPNIAKACAAAQQATMLQMTGAKENGVEAVQMGVGQGMQTNPSLTAKMLSSDAVQKQMNKFFPGLVKGESSMI